MTQRQRAGRELLAMVAVHGGDRDRFSHQALP
jgi:hypothetical protein